MPLQRGHGERNEFRVCRAVFSFFGGIAPEIVAELEVLEVWEESNEIQDLTARSLGFMENKESKRRPKVSEALLNVSDKSGKLQVIYSEFLEVRERGKVMDGAAVDGERGIDVRVQTHARSLDEWKQTKIVRFPEWPMPQVFLVLPGKGFFGYCEGVVGVGYGGDVPRITRHRTREEGGNVVYEVRDDHFQDILRETDGLERTYDGRRVN